MRRMMEVLSFQRLPCLVRGKLYQMSFNASLLLLWLVKMVSRK